MNGVWNPICALTLCTDGKFLASSEPFARELVRETMREILQLAHKLGTTQVEEDTVRIKLEISQRRAEIGTGREMSMLQDIRQSRPLEIDAIIGNAVRLARKHGLELVRLETIYALINARAVELANRPRN